MSEFDKKKIEMAFIRGCSYFLDWLLQNESRLTEDERLFMLRLRGLIHTYSPKPGEKYCKKCLYGFDEHGVTTAQERLDG